MTGTDGATYEYVLRDGSWSGWTSLGGLSSSAPAAIARRGVDVLDLVTRGTNNALYHRFYAPGKGWSPYGSLGGNLTAAPAIDSQDPGALNIWHRGSDGQLFQIHWTGRWSPFLPQCGLLIGAPAVVDRQQNMLDVFVRGGNRTLGQRLRMNYPAGHRGRVYARAYFTLKASAQLRRKTVSRRFVMCG